MEEERKDVQSEVNAEKKEINVSLSEKAINLCFAVVAAILLAFYKILFNFGVFSGVFHGIMSILVFGLAITGVIWNIIKSKNLSFEFWFSAGVAIITFLCM